VKDLATGKLTRTKSNLQSVTPEILKVLGDVYVRHVQVWQNLLSQQPVNDRTAQMMTISLSALKIMRRLIVAGYEFPNRSDVVNQAWSLLTGHVWIFFSSAQKDAVGNEEIIVLLRKHVINIGKLFLDVNTSHPAAFALLPNTLELLGRYWEVAVVHGEAMATQSKKAVNGNTGDDHKLETEVEQNQRLFQEKVALQAMLLFRVCLKMIYSPSATFKCELMLLLSVRV
jgi:hypothetical protein